MKSWFRYGAGHIVEKRNRPPLVIEGQEETRLSQRHIVPEPDDIYRLPPEAERGEEVVLIECMNGAADIKVTTPNGTNNVHLVPGSRLTMTL